MTSSCNDFDQGQYTLQIYLVFFPHSKQTVLSITKLRHVWHITILKNLRHTEIMMTSSNGNIFRVTDPLWGKSTGYRWIPLTKASDAELWYFFDLAWTNGWANNRYAGDLGRHRAHYDVTVLWNKICYSTVVCTHTAIPSILLRLQQPPYGARPLMFYGPMVQCQWLFHVMATYFTSGMNLNSQWTITMTS